MTVHGATRRVALVSSSYTPYPGGVEQHVRSVASELAARGHEVAVWTVDRGERLGVQVIDGIEVHYLPTPLPARSARAVAGFLRALPAAAAAWWRAYRRLRPDVIHVQCFGPNGQYALALSRLTRTPLVLSTHGETFGDDHQVFERSALLRVGMARALRSAEAVTACSQVVLDDLTSRFGFTGGRVVPNGIHLDPGPAPQGPERSSAIFAVGRFEWMKGFDLLLEAFAVAELPPDMELVIGGDGSLRESLRDRAESLGLQHRVRLPGRLHPEQVASFMRSADVVVVPSRREAFGIVVLEAWQAGAPLIATSRGGPATLVNHGVTGLVVDPEDTVALAHALESLVSDRDLAGRLGAAGREAVRAYPWSRVAELYEDCYAGAVRS